MNDRIQELSSARVLITGASGFIGSSLVDYLRPLGCEVHGISRRPRASSPGIARWWQADTSVMDEVRRVFAEVRPEVVFDLASHVAGGRDLALVHETLRYNLVGTVNVLVAATETGAGRVVLAGSMEEPDPREGAPVPAFPYAAAKWAASAYARMFHSLYGTPVAITRMAMVYGPHQRDLRKLVPHVVVSLLRGEQPKLSSGERAADWTLGDDCAEGLALAAVLPGAVGKTVDLGTGILTSVRDVALEIAAIVGNGIEPAFGALSERPREQQHYADIEGAYGILGWRPRTPLRAGLERTVEWFREEMARGAI
jgi:nucleoside-diphosphate-sugar epimerase